MVAGDDRAPGRAPLDEELVRGDDELLEAVRAHQDSVAVEVLATSVSYDGPDGGDAVTIQGRELRISVKRA